MTEVAGVASAVVSSCRPVSHDRAVLSFACDAPLDVHYDVVKLLQRLVDARFRNRHDSDHAGHTKPETERGNASPRAPRAEQVVILGTGRWTDVGVSTSNLALEWPDVVGAGRQFVNIEEDSGHDLRGIRLP